MAEAYSKLFASITRSSIWLEDDQTLRVWVTMLALADRHGYVGASEKGLAAQARVSVEKTREALDKFLAPDTDSRSPEWDGRRIEVADRGWTLLNYERFRDMRDEEAKREADRKRQRDHRDKKRREKEAARAAAPPVLAPVEPPTDHDGSPDETVCPLDITKRAEAIYPDMLEHMPGVTTEQLRDKTREFLTYWTIGAGKFKKRRFWMRKLREDLRLAFEKRRLKAPGEIEHNARDNADDPKVQAERAKIAVQRRLQREAMLPPKKVAAE